MSYCALPPLLPLLTFQMQVKEYNNKSKENTQIIIYTPFYISNAE